MRAECERLRLSEAAASSRAAQLEAALQRLQTDHTALRAERDTEARELRAAVEGVSARLAATGAELDTARARADSLASKGASYDEVKGRLEALVRWAAGFARWMAASTS